MTAAKTATVAKKTSKTAEVKKTSNYRADGGLTKAHIRILEVLKDKTLTCDKLATVLKAKHPKTIRWALGTISADNRDPLSLLARGAVSQKEVTVDGGKEYVYTATASGKASLKKALAAA